MDRLPEELIAYIFDYLQAAHALSSAMLVNRQWYMYGARNLHSRLKISFGFDMAVDSSSVVISLMRRLVSPPLATAHLVRHLAVFGMANAEVQTLTCDVLRHATTLRSLDIHALHLLDSEMLLHQEDIFSLSDFLPNLVALNTRSAPFLDALINSRRLRALRVHEPIDHMALTRLVVPSSDSMRCLQALELAISISTPTDAVAEMENLASALTHAPLRALALQFVLDRPGLMSWPDFEIIGQMGPALQTLSGLSILSLVIRPDPIMFTANPAENGSRERQRELHTRRLAERLISDYGLSRLTRIELRWHGWKIRNSQMEVVPRAELVRLPQSWIYGQCNGRLR
ncbi:hypothetical protein BN946_scf184979.g19 [Trametes cinnabarina]|uniref:F-box domain-containing protein n=1 Tax=Pycnoporus cinnabarinus TaxID=5643 RepID=A0A060SQG9_PYCCI|nr:hypothetical protein BN946_scf184979.g19 [Trametes cinnabarina]